MLLTAYTPDERRHILQGCTDSYVEAGLGRPTSFCAGYSATDPALQALLEGMGFTTSFAAQVVAAGIDGVSYPPCWYRLLAWGEKLTALSAPYRVARDTILPLPGGPHLERLVEVPLNTDTDVRQLYLRGSPVSRPRILDAHWEAVRATARSSCVALGVHDVYLGDETQRGPVLEEMARNLEHVRGLAGRGDVPIRYSTASEVSESVHAGIEPW